MTPLEDHRGRPIDTAVQPGKTWPRRKPCKAEVDIWEEIWREDGYRVMRAFSPYTDFYLVQEREQTAKGTRTKDLARFYGEVAWSDASRFVSDLVGRFVEID